MDTFIIKNCFKSPISQANAEFFGCAREQDDFFPQ